MSVKSVQPSSGRILTTAVKEGFAIVGSLSLPPGFTPQEGHVYMMIRRDDTLSIYTDPVETNINNDLALSNIDGQLANKVWPRPAGSDEVPVRFLSAFPDENIWSVYGVSPFQSQITHDQAWENLEDGRLCEISPPVECRGMSLGQVLSEKAAWPGREGQLYALPQTTSFWREKYRQYHRILIDGARSGSHPRQIKARVKTDPVLRVLADKPIDLAYCRFLSQLDLWGELVEDQPARHAEIVHRQQMAQAAITAVVNPGARSRKPTFRYGR